MKENEELINMINTMINSPFFKWTVGTSITTIMGWSLMGMKSANKKLKNSVSKNELKESEQKNREYTDRQIKIHEEKQALEFLRYSDHIQSTHEMVKKLLDIHL